MSIDLNLFDYVIEAYARLSSGIILVIGLDTFGLFAVGFVLSSAILRKQGWIWIALLMLAFLMTMASAVLGYSAVFWNGYNYAVDHRARSVERDR